MPFGDDNAWPSIFHNVNENACFKTSSLCDNAKHSVTMVQVPKKASLFRWECEIARTNVNTSALYIHIVLNVWQMAMKIRMRRSREKQRERQKGYINLVWLIIHFVFHAFSVCSSTDRPKIRSFFLYFGSWHSSSLLVSKLLTFNRFSSPFVSFRFASIPSHCHHQPKWMVHKFSTKFFEEEKKKHHTIQLAVPSTIQIH